MSNSSANVKRWRKGLKLSLIAGFGSKCYLCGYNKCLRSLHLHHKDEGEKDFGFGFVISHCRNWELICKEAKKCVLLCANCHGEVHEGVTELPLNIEPFNRSVAEEKKLELISDFKQRRSMVSVEQTKIRSTSCDRKRKQKKINHIKQLQYSDKEILKKVKSNNIDFNDYGWVDHISKIINRPKNFVHSWMKINLPDVYDKSCRRGNYSSRYTEIEIKKQNLLNSNIDFNVFGWVTKASHIIGVTPQKVNRWMKKNMPDFYEKRCFKKSRMGETDMI